MNPNKSKYISTVDRAYADAARKTPKTSEIRLLLLLTQRKRKRKTPFAIALSAAC
jgi:hypothetical protein